MLEKTRAFCDSLLAMGLPGFDLAVYRDGECLLRHMGGYSDLEHKIPMQGNERFNIYSCSKPITCTAALLLWEKGLFPLEDKLSDYMPEFAEMTVKTEEGARPAQKPILIKHLFEMTAGFSYATRSPSLLACRSDTDGKCPTREAMTYLAREPLLFEPGERWNYSLCHDVLAALVEVISGEKFEDFVKRRIFDPLGMKDTTFMLPDEELPTIAEQYCFRDGQTINVGKAIRGYKIGSEYASGGAGAISTLEDYIRFLEGLRTHRILKPETLALMTTDRLTEEQKVTLWQKENYGYGLGVRCPKAGGKFTNFGWGGAAGAYLAIDPAHGISIYFATHMLSSPIQGMRVMLYRFVRAELWDESDMPAILEEVKALGNYNLTY